MVKALNFAASAIEADLYGFIGDDHRMRTFGWDDLIAADFEQLDDSGFVYGDDLSQSENLPTAVFISGDIVSRLGWMAPPVLTHLYVDNAWLLLGRALGKIKYDPHVVIEHLHPSSGKAEWDEGYLRVNSQAMYDADRAAFEAWQASELMADLARISA